MEDIDDASMQAILALQLQDLADLAGQPDQAGGAHTDANTAAEIYREELQRATTRFQDRSISRAFADSPDLILREHGFPSSATPVTEAHAPSNESSVNTQPIIDRDEHSLNPSMRSLDDHAQDPLVATPSDPLPTDTTEEISEPSSSEPESWVTAENFQRSDSEASKAIDTDRNEPSLNGDPSSSTCYSCEEELLSEILPVPCGHFYCHECLAHLFRSAMTLESLFPPQCCEQHIPLEDVKHYLNDGFTEAFEARAEELSVPNRVYCFWKMCSAFISPKNISGDKASCSVCSRVTCTICKAGAHEEDCPEDPAVTALMATAAAEGYKRCYSCRCGAQFCYECEARWKTCNCALFNEERLLARARYIVNRDGAQAAGAAQDVQVQQAAQNLRANHACRHDRLYWTRVEEGDLRCEDCETRQRTFIYECPNCHVRMCAECRGELRDRAL
ncbi:MAG: hypothetical protein Q9208_003121 [Pyrenodesmia sp. 3 TL-2023]